MGPNTGRLPTKSGVLTGLHVVAPHGDPGWGLLMEPPGNE